MPRKNLVPAPVFMLMLFGAWAHPAWTQPPETVLIQGQLLDSQGAPIPGLRQYRVRFFDAAAAGTQLGGDIVDVTLITPEGLFAIPVTPPAAVLQAPASWYELAIDSSPTPVGVGPSDVFPGRIRVHSVPFARVAGEALQVDASAIGDGSVSGAEFNALAGISGNVQTQLNAKADASVVYTQVQIDSQQAAQDALIAQKADAADLFQWLVVTGGPVQMQANHGYVVNSVNQVALTLPPGGQLSVGDVVRISGIGAGGWRLNQNSGQQVQAQTILGPDFNTAWISRDSNREWFHVASSADGVKLVAVARFDDKIYTSTDAGATWTPRDEDRHWRAVASSADGTKLVAVELGGLIYTSTNSGETWTPREEVRNWTDVASSADGTKLVATVSGGQIYTSTNSGESWTPRDSNRNWFGVASSADGAKLVAGDYSGFIYTSTDSGETWTPRMTDVGRKWWRIASSADGTKLLAAVDSGQLYTSVDSGVSWTAREDVRHWYSVASSADGVRLVAVTFNGQIYVSNDSGVSWSPVESARLWHAVASSADGTRLVAVVGGGRIYTSPKGLAPLGKPATLGAEGGLSGLQYSAVELQFIGGGRFLPLSASGTINAR